MILFKKDVILGGIVVIFLTFLDTVSVNFQKMPEVICSSQQIKAAPGEEVIFQCSVDTEWDVRKSVEWTRPDLRQDSNKKYVLVYRSKDVDKNLTMASYIGRVFLFREELQYGNVSLKLTNVTVNDSGLYKCFLPSLRKSAIIELLVSDGNDNTSKSFEVLSKDNTSKSQNRPDMKPKIERHWWLVDVFSAAAKVAPYAAAAVGVVVISIYLFKKCKKKKSLKKMTGQNSGEDETSIPLQELYINSE